MRIVLVTGFFNNGVITTVIEMVEMVEIVDERLGKRSVERVRYIINNLLHLVIVKYGVISLVLCISTCLRLVTILSLLVKYLVIFHADPCNKSYWRAREASKGSEQGKRMREASEKLFSHVYGISRYIYIYYIPPPLTVHFSMTRSMRYQPILHTLYVTGSAKRYTNAQAMIFLYKRCCSKTHNIFYSLKKFFWGA